MGVVFTCSIDDGHPSDMKVADLLSKHGLNGTFYVPIHNQEGFDVMSHAQTRELSRRFEIGSHTHDHCFLNGVAIEEARYQIAEGKNRLEDLLGAKVAGFCYPKGQYSRRVVDLVQACGFSYARTTENLRFDAGKKPLEMPTTIQFYPHASGVYVRNFARSGQWLRRFDGLRLAMRENHWIARLYAMFDHACEHQAVFHLWGHSRDIDALNAWTELDRFFAYVASGVPARNRVNNEQLALRTYFNGKLLAGC